MKEILFVCKPVFKNYLAYGAIVPTFERSSIHPSARERVPRNSLKTTHIEGIMAKERSATAPAKTSP